MCIFSELTIGTRQPINVVFPWKDHVSPSQLLSLAVVLCGGLRPRGLSCIRVGLFVGVILGQVLFGQSCW